MSGEIWTSDSYVALRPRSLHICCFALEGTGAWAFILAGQERASSVSSHQGGDQTGRAQRLGWQCRPKQNLKIDGHQTECLQGQIVCEFELNIIVSLLLCCWILFLLRNTLGHASCLLLLFNSRVSYRYWLSIVIGLFTIYCSKPYWPYLAGLFLRNNN